MGKEGSLSRALVASIGNVGIDQRLDLGVGSEHESASSATEDVRQRALNGSG